MMMMLDGDDRYIICLRVLLCEQSKSFVKYPRKNLDATTNAKMMAELFLRISYYSTIASNLAGHYATSGKREGYTVNEVIVHLVSIVILCCLVFYVEWCQHTFQHGGQQQYFRDEEEEEEDEDGEHGGTSRSTFWRNIHLPQITFSEFKLRIIRFLVLFASFLLRYQQLFYIGEWSLVNTMTMY
jgi:general stress protein CsbA